MKTLKYLITGIAFGVIMFKSEAASWFRIFEMFQFNSFHMYGIIGSALATGVIGIQLIKRLKLKSFSGEEIIIQLNLPQKFLKSPNDLSIIISNRYQFDEMIVGILDCGIFNHKIVRLIDSYGLWNIDEFESHLV